MGGKKILKNILLLLSMLALAGCSEESSSREQAGKMTPPIDVKLEVKEESLSSDTIQLTLRVEFESAESKAKAILLESGVIKSAESGRSVLGDWTSIQTGETFSVPFTVKADGYGKGSVRVKVEAYGDNGELKYGLNPYKYFLVKKEEVLTGNNGYMELELEHLDHLREQGGISMNEYDKRKEKIMREN